MPEIKEPKKSEWQSLQDLLKQIIDASMSARDILKVHDEMINLQNQMIHASTQSLKELTERIEALEEISHERR